MTKYMPPPVTHHFIAVTDPRMDRQKAHKLIDIIMIAIAGLLLVVTLGWILRTLVKIG